MTLAFNLFFWDEWLGGTPGGGSGSSLVPAGSSNAGGSSKKKRAKAKIAVPEYIPDPTFWDIREAYLLSIQPPPAEPDVEPDRMAPVREAAARYPSLVADRYDALTAMKQATDLETLKSAASRYESLSKEVAKIESLLRMHNVTL